MGDVISLIGIVVGLGLLMFLAFRGMSILWIAPLCAVLVAAMSRLSVLDAYLVDYIEGVAGYFASWFPAFFLGAIFGKIMDITGSARSLANKIIGLIGSRFAVAAVLLPCLLMTYGGVSLFVVVFVIYPMGYAIYREADIPRTLLPGVIAFGAFGITMLSLPGSPQIQNIIPTEYYGTTAMAAPLMGILASLVIGIPGYLYLESRVRKARREGRHFVEDPKFVEHTSQVHLPSWHWLCGLLPLLLVVLMLNVFPKVLENRFGIALTSNQSVVIGLTVGILAVALMNIYQCKLVVPALNQGAQASIVAIMNTASAVGFGSVVKAVPGFVLLKNGLLNMPGSILFSESVAINVLSGATGSASGGISITLEAMAPQYLEKAQEIGMNPELLHRIATLSGGGSVLPHNGAALTILAVSNCTHKESFFDIFVTCALIPMVTSLGFALIWGLFI